MNKTKIVATLGPKTLTVEKIVTLIHAGMNVARINLSHGDRTSHAHFITIVKEARSLTRMNTAILLDTRGPEIRVDEIEKPLELIAGQQFVISNDSSSPPGASIGVNYSGLAGDVNAGDRILLDDGKIALRVEKVRGDQVITTVLVSGQLSSRKRVSLPDSIVNLPSLSEKDVEDIIFGAEQHVDFIAASFVRKAGDVLAVRSILEKNGGKQDIIAKIENRQGVENIEEILKSADGLMVARGDLGVEMPAEEVPVIQKRLIHASNLLGKPVITATQMLESMISCPTPTRAEASDVTNAIFDGTDAVMLSAETAVGQYPLEAIQFLAKCSEISESSLNYDEILAVNLKYRRPTVTDSISYACCATAADLGAAAILTSTSSGSTARMVARCRPKAPIIAVSPHLDSLRKLQLVRGVTTVLSECASTMDEQLNNSIDAAKKAKLVKNGDLVVITAGMPLGTTGTTNMMKVRTVADLCISGQGIGNESAQGHIRVIKEESDWQNLPADTIIVIKSTDNSMTEKLKQVRGIITEEQGVTSNAALVGLELNIPVVCNVADGTELFQNDEFVTINGPTGHISYGGDSAL